LPSHALSQGTPTAKYAAHDDNLAICEGLGSYVAGLAPGCTITSTLMKSLLICCTKYFCGTILTKTVGLSPAAQMDESNIIDKILKKCIILIFFMKSSGRGIIIKAK
jgi:hypothetical protein